MSPGLWEQVQSALDELSRHDSASRHRLLAHLDENVRNEVEVLLPHLDRVEANPEALQEEIGSADVLGALLHQLRNFEPGGVLLDRFEILEFLGKGGMGEVYRALDRMMGEIAIKTVRLDFAADSAVLERFRLEAQRARMVTHYNVCRVYELFDTPTEDYDSLPFLTMELLKGKTLYEVVNASGAMAETEARAIALQLCAGLAAAHNVLVIHRDFKSSNVILATTESGTKRPVITDFGLARLLSVSNETRTKVEAIAGTRPYLAPELLAGGRATVASDLYSLGVVLFRLVTGKYPGDVPDRISSSNSGRPVCPRDLRRELPQEWDWAICSCLEVDPSRRPATAADVAAILNGKKPANWQGGLRRRAFLMGAGLVAAGIGASELWRRRPVTTLGAESRVLIEEFDSPDADPALGRGVRNLFRLTLQLSSRLRPMKPNEVGAALVKLGIGAVPVKGHSARAVAQTEHVPFLLGGEIRSRGLGYHLRVRVTDAETGEVVRQADETIPDRHDLPVAIDRIAAGLKLVSSERIVRAQVGGAPLEQADTNKPDALEPFTVGLGYFYEGEFQVANEYLKEATRLDQEFGIAWVYQAVVLIASRRPDLALPAAQRAWELRDKLNGRHRHHAEALFYLMNGDWERAHEKFRVLAGLYPDEAQLHRHLAQSFALLLKPDSELRHARKALELDGRSAINHNMFIVSLADNGQWQEAFQACDEAERLLPNSPLVAFAKGYVHMLRSEIEPALKCCEITSRQADMEVTARSQIIKILLLGGRLDEAQQRLELDLQKRMVYKDIPNEDLYRYWLGQLLAVKGNRMAAAEQARTLARRPAIPSSLMALQTAAELAWRTGSVDVLQTLHKKVAQIVGVHDSTRAEGILHQTKGFLLASEGAVSYGIAELTKAHALWPDLSIISAYTELLMLSRRFDQAFATVSQLTKAKASALRFDSVVLWVRSLALASDCLQAAGRAFEAESFQKDYKFHWGNANVKNVLARRM